MNIIEELSKTHIIKKNLEETIYRDVLESCLCYIKYENNSNYKNSVYFKIPEFISGIKITNIKECVVYLVKNMDDNFNFKFIKPRTLFITWPIINVDISNNISNNIVKNTIVKNTIVKNTIVKPKNSENRVKIINKVIKKRRNNYDFFDEEDMSLINNLTI